MKTKKDLIFGIVVLIWLSVSTLGAITYGPNDVTVTNTLGVVLFGILLIFKIKNKRFGNWLEEDLKKIRN